MPKPATPAAPAPTPEAHASAGPSARAHPAPHPTLTPEAILRIAEQFAAIIEQLCLILSEHIETGPLPDRLAAPLLLLAHQSLRGLAVRFAAFAAQAANPAQPTPAQPTPAQPNPGLANPEPRPAAAPAPIGKTAGRAAPTPPRSSTPTAQPHPNPAAESEKPSRRGKAFARLICYDFATKLREGKAGLLF